MLPRSFSLCPSVLLTLLGAGGRTDESKIKREGVRPGKPSFEKETIRIKDPKNRESIFSSSYNRSSDTLTIQIRLGEHLKLSSSHSSQHEYKSQTPPNLRGL